jgi:hypothetical protein
MNNYEIYLRCKEQAIANWMEILIDQGADLKEITVIAKLLEKHDIDPTVLNGIPTKPKSQILKDPRTN